MIGYATYGERISLDERTSTNVATVKTMPDRSEPFVPLKLEKENTHRTVDETSGALLQGYLEVDSDTLQALEGAFGKVAAHKKLVEMTVGAMKAAGNERLIDEYKRQSPLVPEGEKPKATGTKAATQPANVDPQQVATALNGDWYPLRFVANGEDLPDDAMETLKMVFANGNYIMTIGGNIETGTYEFDSSTSPFALTINIGSGKNKGQSRKGSFKLLEENRLLFVMATNEKDHPTKFVSTADNQNILAVYSKR